ncbi:gamma-glutamyl-gamma-aminobutyrate hydrolase family protein [Pedobacter hiemivivus]|uniref:Gamma-glutamyl-gamma-aminobutyrate hydrolase family protein n=1 Tax=Pedobacter hiemivivus TaxID=2530454 RepID=A0A4U1G0J6_9SPHI|nr:gamma-glutamyl-gamma-aminobutyrate hydrolase family protein [Pedobacter hiemivivus]TKC55980.1 gamma-glutamyl-gamma-aminobutyrate hydrolase family protein [Pedobacter hiemivivus]
MKKKLGISYSEANFQNYWNWFTADELGIEIELVELSFRKNNRSDIEKCDGFVLTGGIDVLPAIYGGAEEYPYKPDVFLPERDEFERLIYDYSQKAKLPVLGICRGMQYINILEGGKVFEDNGAALNELHKKGSEDKVHGLNIVEDSLLYAVTGKAVGQVNSAHHQGVDPERLGKNLMANAYADTPDALIEGLEFKDKTGKAFMLGVQWHPERMKEKELNPLSQKIKEQFIQEVKNHKR